MYRIFALIVILFFSSYQAKAQCFASAGNPVGGTANMGVMEKKTLRLAGFYRYSYSGKYMSGDKSYTGSSGILNKAFFNYAGWLAGYGVSDKLTIETEGGYFINKTQSYKFNNECLTGFGLSNAVISVKPRLYVNRDKRIEISGAVGVNIPFSKEFQVVDNVTLPVDIQPSTGSYGLVFQSFFIKEDSFNANRFFLINRIEKYFENNENYLFGSLYSTSFYFSKHFVFEKWKLKDWTMILQLKNQIKQKNKRVNNIVEASGSCLFFLTPQINLSLYDKWNVSVLFDIPIYQHYNEVQLANSYSFAFSLIRDFSFYKNN